MFTRPIRSAAFTAALVVVAAGSSLAATPASAAAPPQWSWPVAAPHPIVRGFEAPATTWAAGHRGIDVAVVVGSAVTAPDDGTVVFAGTLVDRGVVSIDHGAGVISSFEPVAASVHAGDVVARGQPIGVVATGGTHTSGVLHIGARLNGAYVSPLLYLGGIEHAVLLPLR
jgi:murein DD-endopeptidase MepM/ murein hydrolase activator NlpD